MTTQLSHSVKMFCNNYFIAIWIYISFKFFIGMEKLFVKWVPYLEKLGSVLEQFYVGLTQ